MAKKAMSVRKDAFKKKKAKTALKAKATKKGAPKKVRIGILVGKDFDPVKKGTQWPDFPKKYNLTSHEWGKEVTQKRLQKNHVNIAFWYEAGVALMTGDKKHFDEVLKCQKNPECRLDPSWDYYDWVLCKPRYMEQLRKAGVPTIPTVIYKNGFDPKRCLKDVQKMGWDKFFCKVGHFSFFGAGAINGKTADFLGARAKDLDKYAKDNKDAKCFLLQPYTLK